MTKEEFRVKLFNSTNRSILREFDLFFESNVCIPKGDNRHPDADVVHAYAEGVECEIVFSDNTTQRIEGISFFSFGTKQKSVRIKPSEPIYMYQYSYIEQCNDATWEMSAYMTDEEYIDCGISHPDFKARKCEWTKKERK